MAKARRGVHRGRVPSRVTAHTSKPRRPRSSQRPGRARVRSTTSPAPASRGRPTGHSVPSRIKRRSASDWTVDVSFERRVPMLDRMVLKELVQSVLRSLEAPPPRGIRSRGMLPFPPPSVRVISLSFVGDPKIQELNRAYRKKDKPTDVLSFPALTQQDYQELAVDEVKYPLGDIVISLDTAAAQARKFRVSLGEELVRLLIHGILHLLGYDHEKVPRSEAERMRRIERTLLAIHSPLATHLQKSTKKRKP